MNGLARILFIIPMLFAFNFAIAQTPTQVVRGKVSDAEAKTPLPGANVVILNTDPLLGAITNADGTFFIANVKVGRHTIKFSYVGILYNDFNQTIEPQKSDRKSVV